jgi:hypothetical protein
MYFMFRDNSFLRREAFLEKKCTLLSDNSFTLELSHRWEKEINGKFSVYTQYRILSLVPKVPTVLLRNSYTVMAFHGFLDSS